MKRNLYEFWRIMEWTIRVDTWSRSGLSAYQWCRKEKIAYLSFINWRIRLRGGREKDDDDIDLSYLERETSFIELTDENLDESLEENVVEEFSGIILEYGDIKLKLDRGFDQHTLTTCVKILKGIER